MRNRTPKIGYRKDVPTFVNSDCGSTAIEYGLVAGLISVSIVVLLQKIGAQVIGPLKTISDVIAALFS